MQWKIWLLRVSLQPLVLSLGGEEEEKGAVGGGVWDWRLFWWRHLTFSCAAFQVVWCDVMWCERWEVGGGRWAVTWSVMCGQLAGRELWGETGPPPASVWPSCQPTSSQWETMQRTADTVEQEQRKAGNSLESNKFSFIMRQRQSSHLPLSYWGSLWYLRLSESLESNQKVGML